MRVVRVGTRGSALALWQAHVASRLSVVAPATAVQIVEIASAGDKVTEVPLVGSRAILATVTDNDPDALGVAAAGHLLAGGAADVLAPLAASRSGVEA